MRCRPRRWTSAHQPLRHPASRAAAVGQTDAAAQTCRAQQPGCARPRTLGGTAAVRQALSALHAELAHAAAQTCRAQQPGCARPRTLGATAA
eukprot:351939-Chlamydomonas_euryale.AAC.2